MTYFYGKITNSNPIVGKDTSDRQFNTLYVLGGGRQLTKGTASLTWVGALIDSTWVGARGRVGIL